MIGAEPRLATWRPELGQITISRRFEWDAAHRIAGHEGACKAIHGHRYAAEVVVTAPQVDALGRVVDYGVLKALIGDWIDSHFDHSALFDRNDAEPAVKAVAELNGQLGKPVYWLDTPPTAEAIVAELAGVIAPMLAQRGLTLTRIRLWETPNCWAEWAAS